MKLEDLVRKNYSHLNENDIYIWHYIRENKEKCCRYNIEQLANRCNVSRSTIMRFAQKLEFTGFSELKVRLKIECEQYDSGPDKDILDDVCDGYFKLIRDMKNKDFTKICEMIYKADRLFICGSGSVQSFVAQEIKRMFLLLNKCLFHVESRRDEMDAVKNMLTEEDVVILISLSGETGHIIDFAKDIRLKNAQLISFTAMKSNTLANLATENIYMISSDINTAVINFNTTALYFVAAEMLVLKYLQYINRLYE